MKKQNNTFQIWALLLVIIGCMSSVGCYWNRPGCQPRSYYSYPATNSGGCCTSAAPAVAPANYYVPQPQLNSSTTPQPQIQQASKSGWVTAKPAQ